MPETPSADTSQAQQMIDPVELSQKLDTLHQDLDVVNQNLSTLSTQVQAISDEPSPPSPADYSATLDAISGNLQTVSQAVQDFQAQQSEAQPLPDYSQQNADNVQTVAYCALLVTAAVAVALGFAIFDRFLQAWKMRG